MAKACCGHKAESCCDTENISPAESVSNCSTESISNCSADSGSAFCGDAVPVVSTMLDFKDQLGALRVRLGLNRAAYKVNPGLYRVGMPDSEAPVLVTANYKLTFDSLRKELTGLSAWILVLDTKGVNVWCAAGKGTFGTAELIRQIEITGLKDAVSHRRLILPQLGASGIAAHEIGRQTGFKVIYGPVKASDVMDFIKAGMVKTQGMRTVTFGFLDRLILTPAELSYISRPILAIAGIALVLWLSGVDSGLYGGAFPYIGAVLLGNFLVPALLPWIPGAAFSFKGWLIGTLYALILFIAMGEGSWQLLLIYLLSLPPITAYIAMNFTGSSTYTSLAGVLKETRIALPAILISLSLGVIVIAIRLLFAYQGGV